MQHSKHYNFRLPERNAKADAADINDLTYNFEQADGALSNHAARLTSLERDKTPVSDFNAHVVKNTQEHIEICEKSNAIQAATDTHLADNIKHLTLEQRDKLNDKYTKAEVEGKLLTLQQSKADKVIGKQLSTEDYTAAEKQKLSGIAINANNYALPLVQAVGVSTTSVMSQKAVTDALSAHGNGDMMKAVYDANNNGVVDNAEMLGGQPPSYYEPAFTKSSAFNKAFGSAINTVCQGNDSRLSDARPASGGSAATAISIDGGEY